VPRADIIVVTHNCARWLPRMSAALDAQTEQDFRLIVFDNGSKPEERPTKSMLPSGTAIVFSADNLGFAEANNRAAREGQSPVLVFLNPDAFPEPDWLRTLLQTLGGHPGAAVIGSTQVRADDPTRFDGTGDVLHASGIAYRSNFGRPRPRRGSIAPLGETFAACGAAMAVRRDAFEAIAGFDGRYFCYFEDVDLCFRLRLAGWRILQSPDAIVAHVGGGVLGRRSAFSDFHGARNRTWTFIKCMPSELFWPLLPLHLAACAAAATWALFRGRGFGAWRGFLAGLLGWGAMWKSRQELQSKSRASAFAIARVLAWNPMALRDRRAIIRRMRPNPTRT
jgi:GT2 family glycosyltransferase